MELRHLRYFAVLAAEGNFRRAAERLHMSQPPLSRQIRLLEEELGVELLSRSGKRFTLTPAGRALASGAERLLERASALVREVQLHAPEGGARVRIGSVGSLVHSFVPELLVHLSHAFPELRFELKELSSDQQAQALRSGAIDLGFSRGWIESEGLRFAHLGDEFLALIHPASMEAEAGRGLAAFAGRPFVAGTAPGMTERVAEACARAGFQPKPSFECEQFGSILKLVGAGLGWAVIPAEALRRVAVEGVRALRLDERIPYGVAYREGAAPPALAELLEAVIRFAKEREGEGAFSA